MQSKLVPRGFLGQEKISVLVRVFICTWEYLTLFKNWIVRWIKKKYFYSDKKGKRIAEKSGLNWVRSHRARRLTAIGLDSLLTEVSQATRKWERGERPLPAPGKFFDVPSSAILDETKTVLKYRFFRNPGNAPLAHVQIYWLLESLRAHVTKPKTGLPRSRFAWLKCHSLPWDAGACSIGFLPGAGRGLSPLSHFLAAWETSVSREWLGKLKLQHRHEPIYKLWFEN